MKFVCCCCDARARVSSIVKVKETKERVKDTEENRKNTEKEEVKLMKNEKERSQKVISSYLLLSFLMFLLFTLPTNIVNKSSKRAEEANKIFQLFHRRILEFLPVYLVNFFVYETAVVSCPLEQFSMTST